ncbi:condensation domain-containing protein [Paraburkholderia caledonica]|uniref:Aryl carrier-like protein n=1 Tax=Paraburkholderia caledonica TaxID=134536 RepID=A0AB73IKH9_9BURK|nr:aryl carrier-like protein [Paraburkholderia caledonica]
MTMHNDSNGAGAPDEEIEKAAFLAELLGETPPAGSASDHGARERAEPIGEAEATLLRIWRDTLDPDASLDDNYFALGGTSLKSLQISARASRAGFAVAMQDIIEHPTVRTLAAHLAARTHAAAASVASFEPEQDKLGLVYPSTGTQEGILFQCLAAPNHALYVAQFSCRLAGPLDPDRFRQALYVLACRHPALRAGFPAHVMARRCQLIHREVALDYTFDAAPDAGSDWAGDDAAWLDGLARAERARPFDLGRAPLWRVKLVAHGQDRHAWIWTQHHLVADGRAQESLVSEFASVYRRLCEGETVDAAEDRSYCDALVDAYAGRERGQRFWADYLAHFDAPLPLAHCTTETPGAQDARMQPVEHTIALTHAQSAALSAALADARLTVASAFAGWFSLALYATFKRRDLLIGLVMSGRHGERARYRDTVGNLISTVPLRATLNRGRTLRQWMLGLQRSVAQLQQYEHTSMQEVKRWAGRSGALPLFDALFVHERFDTPEALFGTATGLRIEDSRFSVNEGYPLVLVVNDGERLSLTLRHLPQACPDELARALLERVRRLCEDFPESFERDVLEVADACR